MKNVILLFLSIPLFSLTAKGQCSIDIPSNVLPTSGSPEVTITEDNDIHWVCTGQMVTIAGNQNLVYLEYAATLYVTGDNNMIISKGGVAYELPGNNNQLYTTLPTSVVVPGNSNEVILCEVVEFGYPVTPSPDCVEISTALHDPTSSMLSIHPNPVHEQLYIQANEGNALGFARVLDMQGRVVIERSLQHSRTLPVQELPAGVYMLQIETAEGVVVQRVVKE